MSGWIAALAVAATAFLGAFLAGMIPRYFHKTPSGTWISVTAVAAGLLLASAMVIVIPEGFELLFLEHVRGAVPHADRFLGLPPVLASGLAILAGFLLMLVLETHGIAHEFDEETRTSTLLLLGLGIHALTDGLALGASTATGVMAITVPILLAVMVHKIPVAFGLGVFVWQGRAANPLQRILIFSLATPTGLLVTFLFLRQLAHEWIGLILLFSGGTFLYVATIDVLPRVQRHHEAGATLFRRIGLGALLVVITLILFHHFGFEEAAHGR